MFLAPSYPKNAYLLHTQLRHSSYEPYEPAEPAYDDEEPFEPQDPDDAEYPDGTARTPHTINGLDDPDALTNGTAVNTPHANANGDANGNGIVVVGEGAASGGSGGGGGGGGGGGVAAGKKNAVVGLREKKIPEEKRSTTPYMTKYERARVLGTRALQIRYDTYFLFLYFCEELRPQDGGF